MPDPAHPTANPPGFLERLSLLLLREPKDRAQLVELLHGSFEHHLLDADALAIIEGALSASETRVDDILVPRAEMDVLDVDTPVDELLPAVIETAHSRFPVVEGERDHVLGILLAKDLLRLALRPDEEFSVRDWLRPAVFVPQSKRLNVLLREFRVSRNHMAIVVDEYGGVAGLVTIEDVLEQIVGEIEDEYDFDDTQDNIRRDSAGRWRVKARTGIEDFNEAFGTEFSDEDVHTVGGLVLRRLGRMPKRGEQVEMGGLHFSVLRTDSRRIYTLIIDKPAAPAGQ
jgi:magnesium and cobalt transporter